MTVNQSRYKPLEVKQFESIKGVVQVFQERWFQLIVNRKKTVRSPGD